MPKSKEGNVSNIIIIGLMVLVGGFIFIEPVINPVQKIIKIDLIDISQSALNRTFSNNQSYEYLVTKHCKDSIKLLKSGDILISGKFTITTHTEAVKIDRNTKRQIKNKCSQATTKPPNFTGKPGTDLHQAIKTIQTEITSQRKNQNEPIDYPVAITMLIDADDISGPNGSISISQEIINDIKKMNQKENAALVLIGLDTSPTLQSILKKEGIDFCSFEQHKSCTKRVVNKARIRRSISIY